MEIIKNGILNEQIYKRILDNGLEIYICKKEMYLKKIGMFGTKYGSIHNEFLDIESNKSIRVPDGVAHFLEHKLFEQEGENALDLFSKEGISANAYTTFDHTVYFFETIDKFNLGMEMLIKLIKTPYFTDENIKKEQGIIGQEIFMYDDNADFVQYFNCLRCMYSVNPINIDIAGTINSISKINKEILYKCYNNFYNFNNMFIVIVGDVNIEETFELIENNIKRYGIDNNKRVVKSEILEPKQIKEKRIIKKMNLSMPQISIGYKLDIPNIENIVKYELIGEIINHLYFSKSSKFYEEMYNKRIVSDDINFNVEVTKNFAHVIISTVTDKIEIFENRIDSYINDIINIDISESDYENVKKRKIGEILFDSENISNTYRKIIDSILNETEIYRHIDIIQKLNFKDILDFLFLLKEDIKVVSIVK